MAEDRPGDVTADHPDGTLLSHFSIRRKSKKDGVNEQPPTTDKSEDAVADGDNG